MTPEQKAYYVNPAWYGRVNQEVHVALLKCIEKGATYEDAVKTLNEILEPKFLRFDSPTKSVVSTL